MAKIRIKNTRPQLTIGVKLQWRERLHADQCAMLKMNYTKGLMRLNNYTGKSAEYSAPADIQLDRFLHSGIDKQTFFQIITQLINVLRWLGKQKLSVANLELDPQYVFLNRSTREMFLLYIPIDGEEVRGNLRKFLETLVFESSFEMSVNTSFKKELMNLINSNSNINTKTLEQYVRTYCPELYGAIEKSEKSQSRKLSDSRSEYLRQMMNLDEDEIMAQPHEEEGAKSIFREKEGCGTDIFYNGSFDRQSAGKKADCDGTIVLGDESVTLMLEDNEGTVLLDEEEKGTVLLNEGGGTVVLVDNSPDEENMVPKLIRQKTGDIVKVDKPVFRIGKEEGAVDYLIPDNSTISRTHADIITRDGHYYLYDNNSTNRSYVNNIIVQPLKNIEIFDGTVIRLSDEEFEFRVNNY